MTTCALCTPRVLHFMDLLPQPTFLAPLAHFLLPPPIRPIIPRSRNPRIISPASRIVLPWSLLTVPPLLVFLAFLFRLPYHSQATCLSRSPSCTCKRHISIPLASCSKPTFPSPIRP